jgi:hypothetical protein
MSDKPDKKAYQVNPSNLDYRHESVARGYVYEPFYAETEKEARIKVLKFLSNECGVDEDNCDNQLTYITVKVKRYPDNDLFMDNGVLKTKSRIEADQRREERDAGFRKLLDDHPNGYALIRKGGYFYRPNSCGYTEYRTEAGVYTLTRAVNECLGMSDGEYMRPELIDIAEHNKIILAKIAELKTKLIEV